MLQIRVIDRSHISTQKIVDMLNSFVSADIPELEYLPRLSIAPITIQELPYKEKADIYIVGEEYCQSEREIIKHIRSQIGVAALLACAPQTGLPIEATEQLARNGANGRFTLSMEPRDFVEMIIFHSRSVTQNSHSSQLILVDSGKGGAGCTTVVAALGEALSREGKKVCLMDLDYDTQDLSRFLAHQPYVNSSLTELCEGKKSPTKEVIEETFFKVYEDLELYRVPPVVKGEYVFEPRGAVNRTYRTVLDFLDELFDVILVDVAHASYGLKKLLQQHADQVIIVIGSTPASIFANSSALREISRELAGEAQIRLLINNDQKKLLTDKVIIDELMRARSLIASVHQLPYCPNATRWPGSGKTLYSAGSKKTRNAIDDLMQNLSLGITKKSEGILHKLSQKKYFPLHKEKKLLTAPEDVIYAPFENDSKDSTPLFTKATFKEERGEKNYEDVDVVVEMFNAQKAEDRFLG